MNLQQRIVEFVAPEYIRKVADLEETVAQREGDIDQLQNSLAKSQQDAVVLRDSLETLGDMLRDEVISVRSPEAMITELQEQGYDSGMLQLLIDQIGWDAISRVSGDEMQQQRQNLVEQAVRLFRYSPLAQWAIWLWTGWGLGDRITATLEDKNAQEWWDEFVGAERNEQVMGEDRLHELSDWLLVKGNRFLALFTAKTGDNAGRTTVRVLDQDEVTPIANPEDKLDVWFYKRTFSTNGTAGGETLYYPDYRTLLGEGGLLEKRWKALLDKGVVSKRDKRADKQQAGTVASIFHVAHNRKEETSPWGWPITTAAGAWVRGHKQFSEARLGVAMAISQFVRRTRVSGGSRAVRSYISQIASTLSQTNYTDTNPPAAAGGWHAENKAAETKELPMTTGATQAKDDNAMFAWMAGLGLGVFPTSMGLDTSRWATAVEMDKAQAMLFERYQRFWSAQFKKLVRTVLMLGSKYADLGFTEDDVQAEISTDSFSLSDYPAVSEAVAQQVEKMLTPYVELGVLPEDTAKGLLSILWRKSLDALGADIGRDLTTDEAFGVGEEPEEPASPPATTPPEEEPEEEPEPGMELDHVFEQAIISLENGDITPEQFAEFGLATIGDIVKGESDGNDRGKAHTAGEKGSG